MTARTFTFTVAAPSSGLPVLAAGESRLHTFAGWASGSAGSFSRLTWPNGGDNGSWASGHIRGYWDPAGGSSGRVHYFGGSHEFAGADNPGLTGVQQFLIYDLATNAFSRPYIGWSTNVAGALATNHHWDQVAFDSTNRRLLMMIHNEQAVRWNPVDGPYSTSCPQTGPLVTADYATYPETAWPILTANPYGSSSHNSLTWHPNLFGPGQGALVVIAGSSHRSINAWRNSTEGWTTILGPAGETKYMTTTGVGEPTGVYSPTLDMVFGGGGDYPESPGENVRIYYDTTLGRPVWRYNQLQAPADLWPDSIDSQRNLPSPFGATQANNNHRLMLHPDGSPLILENNRTSKVNARVKKLNTTTWQWEHMGYFHPFLDNVRWGARNADGEGGVRDWPIVTIPDRPGIPGMMIALRTVTQNVDDVPKMILWRPQ
jgi:hypothetical protein